jgi:hypothetical protein
MIPEADRQKTEQEWLDACPVPEILVDQVDGGDAKDEQYPLRSSARSAVSSYMGSHRTIVDAIRFDSRGYIERFL